VLAALSSSQFAEWQAFYSLEPWGFWHEWAMAGAVRKTIADVNRGEGQQPYDVEDFMPDDPRPVDPLEALKRVAAMFGAVPAGREP
jgi:hypothetical protein